LTANIRYITSVLKIAAPRRGKHVTQCPENRCSLNGSC